MDIKRTILNALFYHAVSRSGIGTREILMDSMRQWIISCFAFNNEFQDNRFFSKKMVPYRLEYNEIVEMRFSQSRYVKTYRLVANYSSCREERN